MTPDEIDTTCVDGTAAAAIAQAPLPTPATLRARRSLPVQGLRFIVLNLKIMRMVLKGHG